MKKRLHVACAGLLLATLSACADMSYYAQAARGQISLLAEAKPIDRWLEDPTTQEALKSRLKRVREIRAFAATELGLPNNGSYKSFASLDRQFVMWNVVAAPELSLRPERWCFPVAGCVDYRGYYNQQEAQAFAAGLRKKGLDVRVNGVPAYSTLGWFNDPVLSTFIHYPEAELARLVFHELAHQVAYAPGDSQFNESFATAVEEFGVARWLAINGDDEMRARHQTFTYRREGFLKLLDVYRMQLDQVYQSAVSPADKRRQKLALLDALQIDYRSLKQDWGGYTGYDRWFDEPVSNAHFALMSTYHELVPAFHGLLSEKQSLPAFYGAVRSLARMASSQRHLMLDRYKSMTQAPSDRVVKQAAAAAQ